MITGGELLNKAIPTAEPKSDYKPLYEAAVENGFKKDYYTFATQYDSNETFRNVIAKKVGGAKLYDTAPKEERAEKAESVEAQAPTDTQGNEVPTFTAQAPTYSSDSSYLSGNVGVSLGDRENNRRNALERGAENARAQMMNDDNRRFETELNRYTAMKQAAETAEHPAEAKEILKKEYGIGEGEEVREPHAAQDYKERNEEGRFSLFGLKLGESEADKKRNEDVAEFMKTKQGKAYTQEEDATIARFDERIKQMEADIKAKDDELKAKTKGENPFDIYSGYGASGGVGGGVTVNPHQFEINDIVSAYYQLNELKLLREAYADKDKNTFAQAWGEAKRRFPTLAGELATFGMAGLEKSINQASAAMNEGSLTRKAMGLQGAFMNETDRDRSISQDIVNGTFQSLPYMEQFLLTSGVGTATKGVVKGLGTKALLGEAGKMMTREEALAFAKGNALNGLQKGALTFTSDAARAAAQTAMMPMTLKNTFESMAQQGQSGTFLDTYASEFGKGVIENYTELVGEYLPFGKLNTGNKTLDKYMAKAGVNGLPAEMAEEELAIGLHSLAGDGENKWSDYLDGRQQLVTAGSVMGGMGLPIAVVNAGGYSAEKYDNMRQKRSINKAVETTSQSLYNAMGNREGGQWVNAVSNIGMEDMPSFIMEVAGDETLSEDKRGAIIRYAYASTAKKGMNQAKEDKKSGLRKRIEEALGGNVNESTNSLMTAKVAGQSGEMQIIKGNIATNEDGTINEGKSDKVIYYRDADGNIQTTEIQYVEELLENVPTEEATAAIEEQIQGGEDTSNAEEEVPTRNTGDIVSINADGNTMTVKVTGRNADGSYTVTDLVTGTPMQASPSQLEATPLNGMDNGVTVEYEDENGTRKSGTITDMYSNITDGLVMVDNDIVPINRILGVAGTEETNAEPTQEATQEPTQGTEAAPTQEAEPTQEAAPIQTETENEAVTGNVSEAEAQQTEEQEQEAQKPLYEFPRDKKGNINYDKIDDAGMYAAALTEEFGDEAFDVLVDLQAEEKAKHEAEDTSKLSLLDRRRNERGYADRNAFYDEVLNTMAGENTEEEETVQTGRFPRDKKGRIVYSKITDSGEFAAALEEEFGNEAADALQDMTTEEQRRYEATVNENDSTLVRRRKAKEHNEKKSFLYEVLGKLTEEAEQTEEAEPISEAQAEPTAETEPIAAPTQEAQPTQEATAEPTVEASQEEQPTATAEAQPIAETEAQAEPTSQAEPTETTEAQAEPTVEAQPTAPTAEAQPIVEVEAEVIPNDATREATENIARRVAENLGFDINLIDDVDSIPDSESAAREHIKNGTTIMGWFNPATGQGYIYTPNITSEVDAQRTILHEIVAHKGLRALLGKEKFRELSEKVASSWNTDKERLNDAIARVALVHGITPEQAKKDKSLRGEIGDEYMASLAESFLETTNTGHSISTWDKIVEFIREALDKLGLNLINDEDIREFIQKSYNNQVDMAWAKRHEEYEANERAKEEAERRASSEASSEEGVRYSAVDDSRNAIDSKLDTLRGNLITAGQDELYPVKKFLEELVKANGWSGIEGFNNYYMNATAYMGKNNAKMSMFDKKFFAPFAQTLKEIEDKGYKQRDIENYMISKHGQERNAFMQANNPTSTRTDYSGLDAVEAETGMPTQDYIDAFEGNVGQQLIDQLWKQAKDINNFALDELQRGSVTDKAFTDELKNRYQFYVPLKGHDAQTAEDRWDYNPDHSTFYGNPIKAAKGRGSRAFDPLAFMYQQAASAVSTANKNTLRLQLLRLAAKDKSGLTDTDWSWYVKTGVDSVGNAIWERSEPTYDEDPDTYRQNIEAFKQQMENMKQTGDAKMRRGKLDVGDIFITPNSKKMHGVKVFQNGEEKIIYINANPKIAAAINGTDKVYVDYGWLSSISRAMAMNFTTRNPIFVMTNLSRDFIYSSSTLVAKENAKYAEEFLSAMPKVSASLARYVRGKNELDLNDKYDRYVYDYVINGGKTGISNMLEVRKLEKEIQRNIQGKKRITDKGILAALGMMNEFSENICRISTFIASRESGRSIQRSISDAKEVTLNFNRAGNGRYGIAYVRPIYLFCNVAVQALANLYTNVRQNKGAFATLFTSYAVLGTIMPLFAQMCGGGDEYDKLNDWERQNKICIWTGNGFFKIPLPQELRIFYKMGDLGYQFFKGNKTADECALQTTESALDLFPINPAGAVTASWAELTPSAFTPLAQHATNTSFTSQRIVNEWANKNLPGYKKAKTNKRGEPMVNDLVYNISKVLNDYTGGDDVRKGVISPNPDLVQHYARGYFGGMYNILTSAVSIVDATYEATSGKDVEVKIKDTPLKAFYSSADDLVSGSSGIGRQYYDVKSNIEEVARIEKGYRKKMEDGQMNEGQYRKNIGSLYDKVKDLGEVVKSIKKDEKRLKELTGVEQSRLEQDILRRKRDVVQRSKNIEWDY